VIVIGAGNVSSVFVGGVKALGETYAGRPILPALQEIAGIHELAMSVFARRLARYRIIAFSRHECRDLTLTRHFQPVMIDDAFGDAFAANKDTVIAQDHVRAAVEIA
jgi:hypothetical protein